MSHTRVLHRKCIHPGALNEALHATIFTQLRIMLQDFENKGSQSMHHSQSLERKVEELQNALSMASSTAETRFKSAISRMQAQTDSLSAEHATVQNSLRSQVITLQKHVDCTTEELRHAHKHLAEERRGRAQDTQSFRADLEEQRKKVAIAESKTRSISDILEGQEQELQVLHHQVHLMLQHAACNTL